MRANALFSSLLFLFCISLSTNAQAQVNININVNTLPDWAPYNYVEETRYYYIPEIEVYYDIPARMYIYYHKKGWIRSARLPKRLRHFNMYHAHKVSMFDIGPNPYMYFHNHRSKYPVNYNRGHHQPTRVAYVAPPTHKNNGFHTNQAPVRNNNRKDREYVNPQNFRSSNNVRENNKQSTRNEGSNRGNNQNFNRSNQRLNVDRQNISRGNTNGQNRGEMNTRSESQGVRR